MIAYQMVFRVFLRIVTYYCVLLRIIAYYYVLLRVRAHCYYKGHHDNHNDVTLQTPDCTVIETDGIKTGMKTDNSMIILLVLACNSHTLRHLDALR